MPKLICTCGKEFKFTDENLREMAGKPFTCPGCGKIRKMPAPRSAAAPSSAASIFVHESAAAPAIVAAGPLAGSAIRCPDCRSETCQKVQLLYEQGMSGLSGGRGAAFGGSGERATSDDQDFPVPSGPAALNMIARLAPPVRRSTAVPTAGLVIGIMLSSMTLLILIVSAVATLINGVDVELIPGMLCCVVLPFLGGIMLIQASRKNMRAVGNYNAEEWPRLRESWLRKVTCLKCGKIWIPQQPA